MSTYNSNHTGAQLDEALNKALNPDTTPSTGSSNLVTSGAVKDYVDAQASNKLDSSLKGVANGLAELDASGKVPTAQLPAYVDDVLEYTAKANFPTTGETGKIYVDKTTNLTYRWSGSAYVEISPSLALGETSSTAYRGDRGKTAYDHSQLKDGTNPHATTFANIASKPTTLSGYGITDAKIASGTITLGSNSITPLTSSSSLDATKLTGTATINTTGKATTAGTADALKGVTATATELNILDGATLTTTELNYVDGVTSNIQTQLNNKAASSHTHNYAGSDSAGGVANATKTVLINRSSANGNYPILLTNTGDGTTVKQDSVYATSNNTVTLNPSTGTITATKFAGSGESLTGLKEGNLTWGNKAYAGSITPMGMALSEEHSANKTAFINGNAITVEYSTDGGTTYTDSGISASNKSALFTKSYTVQVGGSTAMTTDNYTKLKTRITLTGQDGTNGYLYTDIKKILINANTASTLSMLVETMHGNSTSWVTYGTYEIKGWSGWNDVPIITTLGGGTSQKDRPWKLRFTFSLTACNASYSTTKGIQSFRVFGQNGWTVPSTLGTTGHMYTFDMSKNVTFPATVTATTFSGSGASLTALNASNLSSGTVPAARLPAASTSANGAMSSADKTKLNYTNVAYGTCSTAAATAAKVITVSGNTNWALTAGSRITIKFSATNTASNPTFNVNGTGAKSVWYGTAVITTGSLSYAGYANRPMDFVYDGTQYVFIGWSADNNTTYTNASLGQGYGTCTTAEATAAKVVTLSSYALTTGGIVAVKFTYAVPASATMNINSKGAKAIYYKGAAITAGIIKAGDTATFIYNGSYYHLLTIDRAAVPAGSTTTSVNVSVATTAWAASSTYTGYGFAATVTATGVTASNNIIVGMSATATLAQEEACAAAGVQCKAQAANSITLYAKTKPTVALPITVMIM